MLNKTILVAFGGASPEHEVSVLTAMQAMSALSERHNVLPMYISKSGKWFTGAVLKELEQYKDLNQLEKMAVPCTFSRNETGKTILLETAGTSFFSKPKRHTFDVVLPAFHGADGENGAFQGVCEMFGLPYAGSGVAGSAIGMDKHLAKQLCSANGFPVVPDVCFYEREWVNRREEIIAQIAAMGFPVYVKPVSLGSSIGVSRATDEASLSLSVETAFRYDHHILVEKGVQPLKEINCSVLGTPEDCQASVLEQPVGSEEFLSFKDKYQRGDTGKGMASAERIIPAPLTDAQTAEIQQLSTGIFKALQCSGLVRLDFLVNSETNEVFFNEINTIPGSFSFYLWSESGVPFADLLEKLIQIALDRHRMYAGRVRSYETNLLSEKAARGLKGLKGTK
ncbi:MAG: D-alanine--D-alanine ligase [Bacteroidetes bacterium]|nr:D-alanine--D-alanine ligase [Bacteroidota bacterium]MCH8523429.1 D-alanine--D-alanine ligase [Balneolales bacterium]